MAVASNTSVILQQNAGLGNTTIVRVRGLLSVQPDAYSVDLNVQGALGMGIVSDQAFAAGAASIPGPWSEPDWGGWFVWQAWASRLEFLSAVGVLFSDASERTYMIDSKAMRKVEPNETVVVMAESQAGGVNIHSPFRMLVKLA